MTNSNASFDSMSPDAPPPSTDAGANDARAIVQSWLAEPLAQDVKLAIDRLARSEDVTRIAVMPDVHLASGVCVGNVVATTRLIYPQAVGSDIGCGMAAAAFAASADVLRRERHARRVLEALPTVAPAMRHRSLHAAPPLPDDLAAEPLTAASLGKESQREGRVELGTLGRGNHFVEFQSDEEDRLWLMVHSGSRHMGQAIHLHHTRNATRVAGGLCHLDATTDAGRAYLADVAWARRYADANRRRMIDAIADLLQSVFNIAVHRETLVTCDHNHVRRESHDGRDLWVHR